ncbi:MAG TPA: FHA domain-containing protein, partial [Allosphingosinicella sp.]
MTFLLRQISRSAEGREIIRPTEVAGDRLKIGRAPDSDVHLTDLAVALHHATLQRTSSMRLSVAAEEGLGVELNGRKVTSGVIELASGGEIRIASHLLRVLPAAADAAQIAIDVERVGESANDELARVDTNRFSLVSVMPGKRITAYALIALVLAVFLAWPIYVYSGRASASHAQIVAEQRKQQQSGGETKQAAFSPDTMWSSGALSQVHHNLENQCSACHVKAFEPVQDTACQSCHTNIHNHGDTSRAPGEAMARYLRSQPDLTGWARFQLTVAETFGHSPGRCVDCHTEHEGPQEMPRTAQRFCSDCHSDLDARLPDTRIENASDFGRAHPQFRPLVLINWSGERPNLSRIGIDRNPRENSNLKFPHALHLDP